MSEVVGEGVVHIRADTSGVNVGTAGQQAGTGYTKGFLGSLKGLALGIGGVLAAREVIGFAKDALAEGREAQKVGAATEQIIKSTGGTANVTAGQVGALASAISAKVGVDDEAIQSGANLLLTFKNVRNEAGKGNDVFNRTVESTQDLAAAGFGSIEAASKGLGKALNDPLKGITALGRAGVTFTQGQKDQIAALVETGDLLGAQKIILGEVESQVGGVAEATATSSEKAQVAWDNLKEQVGTALIPMVDRLADLFSSKVVPALSGVIDGSNEAGQVVRQVAGYIADGFDLITGAMSGGGGGGGVFDQILTAAQTALPIIQDVIGSLANDVMTFATAVLPVMADTFVNQVLPAVMALGEYLLTNVVPIFSQVAAIVTESLVPTLVAIATLIYGTLYPALISIVTAVAERLKPVFDQLIATFRDQVLPTLQQVIDQIRTQLIPALTPIITTVVQVIGFLLKLAATILGFVLPPLIRLAGFLLANVLPAVISIITFVARLVGGLISLGKGIGSAVATFARFYASLVTGVAGAISDVVSAVSSLPGKIAGFVSKMVGAGGDLIGGLLRGMRNAATGVGGIVSDVAQAVLGAVKSAINSLIDQFNSAIPNTIGVGPASVDLPDNPIPHLAKGTSNWKGGWSWVGEEGPELVRLPGGSQVLSADKSAAAAGSTGSGVVTVDYDGLVSALLRAGLTGPAINVHPVTDDPEAIAMQVSNRLAVAGTFR